MGNKGYSYETAAKGIIQAIKGYADINAERQKIMGDIMINKIKQKDNWFYQQQETKMKNDMEFENKKRMFDYFKSQYANQGRLDPEQFIQPGTMPEGEKVGNVGGQSTGVQETPMGKAPTWSPVQDQVDVGKVADPANRTSVEVGPTGTLSRRIATGAEAYYAALLRLEKKRPLNKGEKAMKVRLENRIFGAEKQPGKVATQKQVIDLAYKLAQGESGGFATQEDIKAKIPAAKEMLMGGDVTTPEEQSTDEYSPEQEQTIQDNMDAYGKTREEVIQALSDRGLL